MLFIMVHNSKLTKFTICKYNNKLTLGSRSQTLSGENELYLDGNSSYQLISGFYLYYTYFPCLLK